MVLKKLHTEWGLPHARVLLLQPGYSRSSGLERTRWKYTDVGGVGVGHGEGESQKKGFRENGEGELDGSALGKTAQRGEAVGSEGSYSYGWVCTRMHACTHAHTHARTQTSSCSFVKTEFPVSLGLLCS